MKWAEKKITLTFCDKVRKVFDFENVQIEINYFKKLM